MSFQETKKTEKYKLPLQTAFTFHAFHPKAVNDRLYVAGLLACYLLLNLPIPPMAKQWLVDTTVVIDWSKKAYFTSHFSPFTSKAYSYGDSAGFTPDFPFNPAQGENQIQRKCRA